jgi:hypothetical protein
MSRQRKSTLFSREFGQVARDQFGHDIARNESTDVGSQRLSDVEIAAPKAGDGPQETGDSFDVRPDDGGIMALASRKKSPSEPRPHLPRL